jgi:hypothetical protein
LDQNPLSANDRNQPTRANKYIIIIIITIFTVVAVGKGALKFRLNLISHYYKFRINELYCKKTQCRKKVPNFVAQIF